MYPVRFYCVTNEYLLFNLIIIELKSFLFCLWQKSETMSSTYFVYLLLSKVTTVSFRRRNEKKQVEEKERCGDSCKEDLGA